MDSSARPSEYRRSLQAPPTFLSPKAARARLRVLVREFLDLDLPEYSYGSEAPRPTQVSLEVRYGNNHQLVVDRCRLMGPVVAQVDSEGRRIYDAARFLNWSEAAAESEMWAAIEAIEHPLMVTMCKTIATREILCEHEFGPASTRDRLQS